MSADTFVAAMREFMLRQLCLSPETVADYLSDGNAAAVVKALDAKAIGTVSVVGACQCTLFKPSSRVDFRVCLCRCDDSVQ
jgi:hypothetical protein